ncbi:hypothetical protein Dda3937_03223 [Dickeya dadantii 3937]|uniref:Uncharacterized protein n=1 Tax=Dickeya dadantii (strain 3937) TaxID=198628 RepID=E0SME1_DICD3|nr:hypothetical protein Dda3937_03223 [Dickeya dadantii 3937]
MFDEVGNRTPRPPSIIMNNPPPCVFLMLLLTGFRPGFFMSINRQKYYSIRNIWGYLSLAASWKISSSQTGISSSATSSGITTSCSGEYFLSFRLTRNTSHCCWCRFTPIIRPNTL